MKYHAVLFVVGITFLTAQDAEIAHLSRHATTESPVPNVIDVGSYETNEFNEVGMSERTEYKPSPTNSVAVFVSDEQNEFSDDTETEQRRDSLSISRQTIGAVNNLSSAPQQKKHKKSSLTLLCASCWDCCGKK